MGIRNGLIGSKSELQQSECMYVMFLGLCLSNTTEFVR